MITPSVIAFSLVAAGLVWLAGRRDTARDPRLTVIALILLGGFPLLALLPKVEVPGSALSVLPEAGFNWMAWLGWVWAAGVVLFSLRLAAALAQLIVWRRKSVPVEDLPFLHHQPEIRVLDGLACPVAAGVIRPLILVPPTWHDWSPALRQTVVAHEAAHHARRDPLWRAVAAVTCALHWWNPLVWWMAARLADQCEYACDERVVRGGKAARGYAENLLDVACVCRAPATALAMASQGGLEARVRRMLAPPPEGSWLAFACFTTIALACALALAVIDWMPQDHVPGVDVEEIRTRFLADPFPGG